MQNRPHEMFFIFRGQMNQFLLDFGVYSVINHGPEDAPENYYKFEATVQGKTLWMYVTAADCEPLVKSETENFS